MSQMRLLRREFLCSVACLSAVAARPSSASSPITREVLAFYYGWWGNPTVSHKWNHWIVGSNSRQATNITDQPQDGLYDSHDPAEVTKQVQEARDCGLTGLIASWWGPGDFTDQGLPLLLETAAAKGLKITAYVERIIGATEAEKKINAIQQLVYLVKIYTNHPAWLRVGPQPVVFLYSRATNALSAEDWVDVLKQVRAQSPNGLVVIGPAYGPPLLEAFDGFAVYNVTGLTHALSPQDAAGKLHGFYKAVNEAKQTGKISCITIIPGFDNKTPEITTQRQAGALYEALFRTAIDLDPNWIVVTSWNEWHEGSEIEPSMQYGETYLKLTKGFAAKFLTR